VGIILSIDKLTRVLEFKALTTSVYILFENFSLSKSVFSMSCSKGSYEQMQHKKHKIIANKTIRQDNNQYYFKDVFEHKNIFEKSSFI
jgi:hypothetical protein